jgi:hypothetical protein
VGRDIATPMLCSSIAADRAAGIGPRVRACCGGLGAVRCSLYALGGDCCCIGCGGGGGISGGSPASILSLARRTDPPPPSIVLAPKPAGSGDRCEFMLCRLICEQVNELINDLWVATADHSL